MHNVLLIILITYVQSLQTDVHQHNGITWNQARDKCKPFGLENRVDYLQKSAILDKREFWIGKAIYREPTRWIEIIGCVSIRERDAFHSVASVGACQQKCESENRGMNFGYRKRHQKNCACQHINIEWHHQRVDSCAQSENFFVYKYYNGRVHESLDPGNCTSICCGTCNMPTKNVNQLESRRCGTVDNRIIGRCGKGFNIWNKDYFKSLDLCIHKNGLFPDSNYCQEKSKQSGQMTWTKVFRDEIEIMKTKDSSVTESITQSTLSTIDMSKDKENIFSVGQSLTSANGNKSLHTQGPINTDTISRSSLFTLDMSKGAQTSTSSGQLKSISNHKTSPTGAMIGGILGACCIICVSAVLIACKIRSKGIFKETTKSVKEDTNQLHFSNSIYQDSNNTSDRMSAMPTSNQTYGLDGVSTPVYAEVNKSKKLENPDETYTDAGYGEYDHLHDIQNRKTCPQENIYDSHGALRNEEDQTYDSSDFGKGKINERNDLYEHSFSVVEGDYMSNGNHDSHNKYNANIYNRAT